MKPSINLYKRIMDLRRAGWSVRRISDGQHFTKSPARHVRLLSTRELVMVHEQVTNGL